MLRKESGAKSVPVVPPPAIAATPEAEVGSTGSLKVIWTNVFLGQPPPAHGRGRVSSTCGGVRSTKVDTSKRHSYPAPPEISDVKIDCPLVSRSPWDPPSKRTT